MKNWKQFIMDPENENVLKEISDWGNLSTLVVFTTPHPHFHSVSWAVAVVVEISNVYQDWCEHHRYHLHTYFLFFSPLSLSLPSSVSASIKLSSNFAPKLTWHDTDSVRLQRVKLYLQFGSNILPSSVKSFWKDKLLYL